jgi:hypothetical protein
MGLEFLVRVRKTSILLGLITAPVIATYFGIGSGGAWLAGIAWSLINLHCIAELVKLIVTNRKRRYASIAILMAAKFPLLYAAGYLLLESGVLPVMGLLAGFAWPLFVTTMKALGRAALKLDERRTAGAGKKEQALLGSN